jgi:hypothetical protein
MGQSYISDLANLTKADEFSILKLVFKNLEIDNLYQPKRINFVL